MIPVANFLSYFVCGIIFAAIAGIGGFRWARLVSLALSVPAALLGCFYFLGTLLVYFYESDDSHPATLLFLLIGLAICLLLISMPVFWIVLFRKSSTRALTNR